MNDDLLNGIIDNEPHLILLDHGLYTGKMEERQKGFPGNGKIEDSVRFLSFEGDTIVKKLTERSMKIRAPAASR